MELRKNRLRVDEIPMTSLQDTEQIHAIKQMRKEGMFFKNQVGQACCPLLPRDSAENSMGKWIKFGAFLEEMGFKNWIEFRGMAKEIGRLRMKLECLDLGWDYKHHKHHKLAVAG